MFFLSPFEFLPLSLLGKTNDCQESSQWGRCGGGVPSPPNQDQKSQISIRVLIEIIWGVSQVMSVYPGSFGYRGRSRGEGLELEHTWDEETKSDGIFIVDGGRHRRRHNYVVKEKRTHQKMVQ